MMMQFKVYLKTQHAEDTPLEFYKPALSYQIDKSSGVVTFYSNADYSGLLLGIIPLSEIKYILLVAE